MAGEDEKHSRNAATRTGQCITRLMEVSGRYNHARHEGGRLALYLSLIIDSVAVNIAWARGCADT